ncbi:MAG: hypothetical protein U0136_00415 [Bdellovibrionota bacterium]
MSGCSLLTQSEVEEHEIGDTPVRAGELPAASPDARASLRQPPDVTTQKRPLAFDESNPPSFKEIVANAEERARDGTADDQLSEFGNRWFYGGGVGRTIANVGTVVVFPPYALYLLGNAGLALAGYQPVHVTEALPDPARDTVNEIYDGVTSVPGRITSAIAGKPFAGH